MKITGNKEKEKEFIKHIQSVKKLDIIIEGIIKKDFSIRRDEAIDRLFKMAMDGLLPEDVSNLVKDIKRVDQNREQIEETANQLTEQLYSLLNQKYRVEFDFIKLLQEIQKELESKKEEALEAEPPSSQKKKKKTSLKSPHDVDMREVIINPKEGIC